MESVTISDSLAGDNSSWIALSQEEVQDILLVKNRQLVHRLAPTLTYLALLIVGGLVGNSIVFLVYLRRYRPSAMRTLILAMCVSDLMLNCLALPGDVTIVTYHFTLQAPLCKGIMTVTGTLLFFSAFVLVVVAVDRYRKICCPTARQTTPTAAIIAIVVVAVVSVLAGIPLPILYGAHYVQVRDEDDSGRVVNVTGVTCSIASDWVESKLNAAFSLYIMAALVIVIILMALAYCSIARTLWLHRKHNLPALAGSRRDRTRQAPVVLAQFREDSSSSGTSPGTSSTNPSSDDKEATDSPGMRRAAESSDHCNTGLGEGVARQKLVRETRFHSSSASPAPSRTAVTSSGPRKATTRSVQGSRVKKIPKSTTLMMFVLTALFVLNFLPFAIVKIVQKGRDVVEESDAILNVVYISFRSRFMNSAVNPIVYSFCSARFRQECVNLFRRR